MLSISKEIGTGRQTIDVVVEEEEEEEEEEVICSDVVSNLKSS